MILIEQVTNRWVDTYFLFTICIPQQKKSPKCIRIWHPPQGANHLTGSLEHFTPLTEASDFSPKTQKRAAYQPILEVKGSPLMATHLLKMLWFLNPVSLSVWCITSGSLQENEANLIDSEEDNGSLEFSHGISTMNMSRFPSFLQVWHRGEKR